MIKPRNDYRASNCYDIYKQGGIKQDGIYQIYLSGSDKPTRVYCEMQKGGWTRILNRVDRLTPAFDRVWEDYTSGFGELEGNHWLGLRAMQLLTHQEQMTLRIEVASEGGRDAEFIEYTSFLVWPESERFKIQINMSSRGTLNDWMWSFHNGMMFYSKGFLLIILYVYHIFACLLIFYLFLDLDSISNCATENLGGWWFNPNSCYRVCLTCAKLTHGQYSAPGSDPSMPTSRKDKMKMLIRPTE